MGYVEPWLGGLAIGILLLSSILNALYYLPIIIQGWFHSPQENEDEDHPFNEKPPLPRYKTPYTVIITMVALVVLILAFGIYPGPIINICRDVIQSVTPLNSCPVLF
jgi:NADH:ubiquinone oxidoreductase subunit 2 (subunit N)